MSKIIILYCQKYFTCQNTYFTMSKIPDFIVKFNLHVKIKIPFISVPAPFISITDEE